MSDINIGDKVKVIPWEGNIDGLVWHDAMRFSNSGNRVVDKIYGCIIVEDEYSNEDSVNWYIPISQVYKVNGELND